MKYSIEPIFIIFPAICLLVSLLNKRRDPKLNWILGAGFILIYSFSLNGADLKGYETLYNFLAQGVPISKIHGEAGFNLIMQVFAKHEVDYLLFRVLVLVITTVVLFICMHKISRDFALSLFFISTLFPIYTISAYRQYITMVFSIFWMIVYEKGYKWAAILGTAFLMLFHIIAIVPLAFLLVYHFVSLQDRKAAADYLCRNTAFLVFFSLLLRLFNYLVLRTGALNALLNRVIGLYARYPAELINAGFLSRMAFLILITYINKMKKTDNVMYQMFFLFYSVGMLLYIVVPLDLVMGRLMNNAYFLSVILVPCLIMEPFHAVQAKDLIVAKTKNVKFATLGLVFVAFAVLISQLTRQSGYYPYRNLLNFLFK